MQYNVIAHPFLIFDIGPVVSICRRCRGLLKVAVTLIVMMDGFFRLYRVLEVFTRTNEGRQLRRWSSHALSMMMIMMMMMMMRLLMANGNNIVVDFEC